MRKIYISFSDGKKWVVIDGDFSLWQILLNSFRPALLPQDFFNKLFNQLRQLNQPPHNENKDVDEYDVSDPMEEKRIDQKQQKEVKPIEKRKISTSKIVDSIAGETNGTTSDGTATQK